MQLLQQRVFSFPKNDKERFVSEQSHKILNFMAFHATIKPYLDYKRILFGSFSAFVFPVFGCTYCMDGEKDVRLQHVSSRFVR